MQKLSHVGMTIIMVISLFVGQAMGLSHILTGTTVDVDWENDPAFWSGPVVVDIDNDGSTAEFITLSHTSIFVHESDGDEREEIPVDLDAGHHLYCEAAVGRVPGIDELGIVVTSMRSELHVGVDGFTEYFGNLYIYDQAGNLLATTDEGEEFEGWGIPQLADVNRDGKNEIVIAGYHGSQNLNDYQIRIFSIPDLDPQATEELTLIGIADDYAPNHLLNGRPLGAAIGDMNRDGLQEIFVGCNCGCILYKFDPSLQLEARLVEQWHVTFAVNQQQGDSFDDEYAGQPVMVDFKNDGELRALILRDRKETRGQGTARTILEVRNYANQLDVTWDGEDPDEGFAEEALGADICVGDAFDDGEITVGVSLNGNLYWRTSSNELLDGADQNDWPRGLPDDYFASPIMARIGSQDHDIPRLIATMANDEGDILGWKPDNNGNADFTLYVTDDDDPELYTYGSVLAIGKLDDDDILDICTRYTYLWGRVEDEIWVESYPFTYQHAWEFNVELEEPLVAVEWSQRGNGPHHKGQYAQSYQGAFPGNTYWTGRVILTDDLYLDENDCIITTSKAPTVVEFGGAGAGEDVITLTYANPAGFLHEIGGPYRVQYKPNFDGAELIVEAAEPPEPPDDPQQNIDFVNVSWVIPDGGYLEFENCTFTGDGSGTAFTADDADLTFINCTFDNYATAVAMDGGTAVFQGCTFTDMTGTVLDIANCTTTNAVTIEECTITGSNGMAIYSYNSQVVMDGKIIADLAMLD